MSPETLRTETQLPSNLSKAEADELSMNAFLGALDDHVGEFYSNTPERRPDDEIMASIIGMRDTASEHYSGVMVQQLNLMDAFDARLQEMCNMHGEFGSAMDNYADRQGLSTEPHQHSDHAHLPGNETKENKKDKKKNKKKRYSGLLGLFFKD